MKTGDEFEEILSDALAEYREAEALAGLEARVLLRLQDRARSSRAWLTWSFATALLIALVALAVWLVPKTPEKEQLRQQSGLQPRKAPSIAETKAAVPTKPMAQLPQMTHRERRKSVTANSAAVRAAPVIREQFPSPAPLSPDERALLLLAQTNPQVLKTTTKRDAEIDIAPIKIEPLAQEIAGAEGEN